MSHILLKRKINYNCQFCLNLFSKWIWKTSEELFKLRHELNWTTLYWLVHLISEVILNDDQSFHPHFLERHLAKKRDGDWTCWMLWGTIHIKWLIKIELTALALIYLQDLIKSINAYNTLATIESPLKTEILKMWWRQHQLQWQNKQSELRQCLRTTNVVSIMAENSLVTTAMTTQSTTRKATPTIVTIIACNNVSTSRMLTARTLAVPTYSTTVIATWIWSHAQKRSIMTTTITLWTTTQS